jgi:hypothetical protein
MRLNLFEVLMDCGDTELLAELYDLNDKYEKCVAFLKRMRGGDGSADRCC